MNSRYSTEFLAARKADLLRQKSELEQELHQIARFDPAAGSWVALQPDYDQGSSEDIGDSSAETEALQNNQAQVSELEKSLEETDHALDKLAQGAYGKCEETGDWIAEDRLTAYPAARSCTND